MVPPCMRRATNARRRRVGFGNVDLLPLPIADPPAGFAPLTSSSVPTTYIHRVSKEKIRYPRLGSFEVTIRGRGKGGEVFSKLALRKWPNPDGLSRKVAAVLHSRAPPLPPAAGSRPSSRSSGGVHGGGVARPNSSVGMRSGERSASPRGGSHAQSVPALHSNGHATKPPQLPLHVLHSSDGA